MSKLGLARQEIFKNLTPIRGYPLDIHRTDLHISAPSVYRDCPAKIQPFGLSLWVSKGYQLFLGSQGGGQFALVEISIVTKTLKFSQKFQTTIFLKSMSLKEQGLKSETLFLKELDKAAQLKKKNKVKLAGYQVDKGNIEFKEFLKCKALAPKQ